MTPQVPINDKKFFPIYAKCIELGIPSSACTTGVPGPRVPMAPPADRAHRRGGAAIFPELTFVIRHGAEPWDELAVKLMLKWPNLYYSDLGVRPPVLPRGRSSTSPTAGAARRSCYAGYFPMGLSLERILADLPNVGFKDEVWPKFLRDNCRAGVRAVSRFPFPIPFGWFCVGSPDEFDRRLAPGAVLPGPPPGRLASTTLSGPCTCRTRSAPTSAPTSATAASSSEQLHRSARSTGGSSTPRAPTSTSPTRSMDQPPQGPACAPTRWSRPTACR